jgi:DNA polymerase elongation subunit (family B)
VFYFGKNREMQILRNQLTDQHESKFLAVEKLCLLQNKMYLFGVDEHNRHHKCLINDFTPHFLIKWPEVNDIADNVVEQLNMFLIDAICLPGSKANWKIPKDEEEEDVVSPIVHGDWEFRTPFYGFSNHRKDPMLRLYFVDVTTMNLCKTKLLEENYELYHHDWDPKLMLLHQTGLRYGDWISLPSGIPPHLHYVATDKLKKVERNQVPSSLKCFIRHVAMSQASIHTDETFRLPDPSRPADRVLACTLDFAWTSMTKDEHVRYITLSLIPPSENQTGDYIFCQTEEDLLERIVHFIQEYQPEDIIQCNDNGAYSTLYYLFQRAITMSIHPNPFTKLESVGKAYPNKENIKLNTRNCLDIAYFLRRKPFLPIEEYTLFEFASMSKIVSKDNVRRWNDMYWQRNLVNSWFKQGKWDMIIKKLTQEVEIMRQVEFGLQMRVELYGIQKTNDTDFSDTANRGEQIRASNAIKYFLHHRNYYINSKLIADKQPLLVKLTEYPPTFPPIDYIPLCEDLRARCEAEFNKLTPSNTVFKESCIKPKDEDDNNESDEEDENACQGGNVVKPCPNHWIYDVIAVFDFQSLYPNIMIRFNISHDCILYEACYDHLEGVSYITVPIDGVHGIRFAVTTPGISPSPLSYLMFS